MAYLFPSDEWAKALMDVLNQSEAYAQAAKNWEGDCFFTIEPEGSMTRPVNLWFDLWHGKCRAAREIPPEEDITPAFRFSGKLSTYRKIFDGKLDAIKALMTRQLKLQGDMKAIMRAPKAAQELVRCATQVDTVYPE
ncbi:MAG: SCP2 sterol-binding domain-containing protein [Anaerolineae bacterium]|nr:SCP2 sterol-binding domain-containing protein [Anaerolineae bacterium]